jgi:hypothetical protein
MGLIIVLLTLWIICSILSQFELHEKEEIHHECTSEANKTEEIKRNWNKQEMEREKELLTLIIDRVWLNELGTCSKIN